MSRVIKVSHGFSPNAYASISEAVSVTTIVPASEKIKCESINGHLVLGYQFNGSCLVVSFDNGKYLVVFPGKEKIEWDVVTDKPTFNEQIHSENSDIIFELPSGNHFSWDWEKILDTFVGRQVAISPSDQFLFIFYRGGAEYIFTSLLDKEDINRQYLLISEA
ncbi:MAG: hypothetical protein MI756_03385 [Chromatiales bacterium]|nr:hypothetical protein [Chromatiales bacterium]